MKQSVIPRCLLLLILPGLLSACGGEQEPASPDVDARRQEIRFNYFLQEGDKLIPLNTAGAPHAAGAASRADNDLSSNVYLYGWWNTVDVPTEPGVASPEDGSRCFFEWTSITAAGTYTGDRRYWIADGKTRHSFCAYSGPAWTLAGDQSFGVEQAFDRNRGNLSKAAFYPVLTFHQRHDPALQYDFLVGYGPTNIVVSGATPVVNIRLHHACARILLKLMVSGGVTLYDCNVTMTYQPNVVSKAAGVYYQPKLNESWLGANDKCTGTFTLKSGLLVPASATSENLAVTAGDMKLVPQPLPSPWLTVSVAYKLSAQGEVKTVQTELPGMVIESELQYTYYLTVLDQSESLSVAEVTLAPWTTERPLIDPLQ